MNLVTATRRAIERRMSISDFDSVLDMIAGGGTPSYTGKLIGPSNAMAIPTFWSCVKALGDDFATLPMEPFEWVEPGVSKREARDHYLWPLLTEEANPRMSSWDFKQQMEVWRNVWGNCYAYVDTNGRGQVTALWPWRPDRVKVWLRDPNDFRSELVYAYVPLDRSQKPIVAPAERMLHVRNMSLDGLVGLSTVQVFRHTLGLAEAQTEFAGRFYGNGATVKGVITTPGKLGVKGEQNLRESIEQYRGLSNAHRMLLLEEGVTYTPQTMPLNDAQFIESMGFTGEDIARILMMPQHRVGLLAHATNNNIVQMAMEYVQFTLGTNAANWQGRLHCSLLSARERDSIALFPDYNYLLAGDPNMRAALYTVLANTGAFGADDIRHREGENPLKGGIGKTPRVPLNTVPLGSDRASGKAEPPPAAPVVQPAAPTTEPKTNGHAALQ